RASARSAPIRRSCRSRASQWSPSHGGTYAAAMTELWQQTASELAAMIAGKEVSSVEVIDAHLARIEAVNPHLNAITRVLADEARAGAKAADAALASG